MADREVERITQNALAALYARLNEELAERNGYQRIDNLAPEEEATEGTYYGDAISENPNTLKARVQHFNRAMKARQYIKPVGGHSFNENTEE